MSLIKTLLIRPSGKFLFYQMQITWRQKIASQIVFEIQNFQQAADDLGSGASDSNLNTNSSPGSGSNSGSTSVYDSNSNSSSHNPSRSNANENLNMVQSKQDFFQNGIVSYQL